ncbi:MAG: bifunctional UDP-N-acetylmuramoyl-tripeptide:D-alanyl-D-alanine ligase/alanine racemase [Sphingobacteriaceae bacterium]|nr:bifunctional UDP-N-acetylmuramoyl-tripeptide:D-alanyl-D-alanine ligase/alanine racemase [Sphingobacteriaceae bacterium]
MPIKLSQLVKIVGGKLLREGLSNDISELAYDTRRLAMPERTAFFALKTAGADGADYIDAAYRAGVRTFVVGNNFFPDKRWYEGSFIAVDAPIKALQAAAAWHRKQFSIPVVGITGSNGKTVVKDWLSWLLEANKQVCRSPKSYNSQIGVPISVWQLDDSDEVAIFEAGISQPGEMAALMRVIAPTHGIFTHLGDAHSENFSEPALKVAEKMQLFESVESLVLRTDHPLLQQAAKAWQKSHPNKVLLDWSSSEGAAWQLIATQEQHEGLYIQLQARNGTQESFSIPFTDAASLENAVHCWVFLRDFGYAAEVLVPRFARLPRLQMRMEMKAALQGSTLINDSYSLDLDSLRLALQQLSSLTQHPRRLVILSDFDRQQGPREAHYREAAQLLQEYGVDQLLAVGPEMKQFQRLFKTGSARFYENTEQLLADLPVKELVNTAILLKGARKFSFERIERLLALKLHQTVLEVDLDALLHNYRFFRGLVRPQTKIMVMVKAFSYGSGSIEVASLLQHQRADYLAVAFADEGVVLREAGIRLPIMVMNVEPSGLEKLLQYQLEPEVYSFRLLEELETYLKATGGEEPLNIHLNIDTGMKRLGFETSEVPALLRRLQASPRIRVASVYSHLVASDAPEHQAFTLQQINRFDGAYQQLAAGLGYRPLQHVLNTAGILHYPQAQFDMVRLGIGLYGSDPSSQANSPAKSQQQTLLQPVSTLKTVISQIHQLEAGETVGYSRRGKTQAAAKIATLPIGYADGLVRAFGNGAAQFWVNGKLAPTIGSICMDMCMIDVTGIDCREGDPVIVFGKEQPINKLAEAIGTIPYEILTNVSQRVKRVYLKD